MARIDLRVALVPLLMMAGMQKGYAEDCDPPYVYRQPPCAQTVKVCYVELVRELTEHTRTVMRTVYRNEPCCDGCDDCGKCVRKVAVEVPVEEKYTECKIVPR